MRKIICVIGFLLLWGRTFSQIVNIETQRIQSDTTGWLGSIGSSFSFEKNVVEVLNISTMVHVEYKTHKSLYLVLMNYQFLGGSGQTLDNNFFYHLRYNYKLGPVVRWEAFTQLQNNRITGIRSRFLVGSGPRFKILKSSHFALYASTAAMYEFEKEETSPLTTQEGIRSSSYISANFKPSGKAEFITTLFYQPLFRNFNDYRILNEVSIKLKFTKRFDFSIGWQYLYDNNPVPLVPKLSYRITNGIEYHF